MHFHCVAHRLSNVRVGDVEAVGSNLERVSE
jgi:hypothetical protein